MNKYVVIPGHVQIKIQPLNTVPESENYKLYLQCF